MQNVLLSICISSYNKGNMCARLVKNLLTIEDNRFNIFICDDCSEENTLQILHQIESPKVYLVQNEKNVGACKNWYKTIDCGDGKYILQVLDRDDIDVSTIPDILDLLEDCAIGAGYIGKTVIDLAGSERRGKFAIYPKGKRAFLAMAGVPVHPTGFLVSKEIWDKLSFEKFFDQDVKYGIYPHSYVLGIIAAKQNMLYMPVLFHTYRYRDENKRSAFYQKNNQKNYWWLPDNVMKTANRLILYLYHYAGDEYKEEFVVKRAEEGLIRATRNYKYTVSDPLEMEHYGLEANDVSRIELFGISIKYYLVFKHILSKLDIRSKRMRRKWNKIWMENFEYIVKLI